MNDLLINVTAGLVSGVVAPLIVIRLGGGTPPSAAQESTGPRPAQKASIGGSHNTVTQNIDQSTAVEVIYARLPSPGGDRAHGSPGTDSAQQDDTRDRALGVLAAAAVLVLTYVLIWPVVAYAFAGAAVGIALVTTLTAIGTRGTPGPRLTAMGLMMLSAAVMLLGAWWTMNGGPGSDASFANLEASITERYPKFSDGLEGRWAVVTSQPVEILTILGMRGVVYVLTQVGALVFAGLLVWARAQEISGWIALHSLTHNHSNHRLIDRAVQFKELGTRAVAGTLIAAVAVLLCAGGWAYSLLENAQEHGAESIVDTR